MCDRAKFVSRRYTHTNILKINDRQSASRENGKLNNRREAEQNK